MLKKLLLGAFAAALSLVLLGCENLNLSTLPTDITLPTNVTLPSSTEDTTSTEMDFDSWLNSGEALDLDGDRKIDEVDYQLYQLQNNYDLWKNSDDAIDMNGDQLIDENDHELYLLYQLFTYWLNSDVAEDLNGDSIIDETDHDIYRYYDNWKQSSEANDLNDDSVIDLEDYQIYQLYDEFVGEYTITNYTYDGSPYNIIGEDNGGEVIFFSDLGTYLSQITISIDYSGSVSVDMPEEVRTALGEITSVVLEAAENMTIERISPTIASIDTFVDIKDVEGNFSLYLTTEENGYSTSYVIGFFIENPEITFDLIKVE
jgi:hypothetical protein